MARAAWCSKLLLGGAVVLVAAAGGAKAQDTVIVPAVWNRLEAGTGTAVVWVFFADKGYSSAAAEQAALQGLEQTYDARAVERRRLRRTDPGLFDSRDLPVFDGYAEMVRGTGAVERIQSRWANAMSVQVNRDQLLDIARMPFVTSIQPVREGHSCGVVAWQPETARPYGERDFYGRSSAQIDQMNVIAMHARGYTGRNVIVGILDTGFNRIHNVFNNPVHPVRIIAEHDFINNDGNTGIEAGDPDGQHSHGTLILSCLGSYLPDEMVGAAYDASFVLCKTEVVPTETQIEEDYYAAGVEFIESHGGDLTTSSLSYSDWYTEADMNGHTAVTTLALNAAAANGVHCCTAAGNAGHDDNPATATLGAPADALKVLTCGSVNIAGVESSFSTDGPTADGRIKPELMACGRNTACVNPDTVDTYATASGTSLSTPLLAGAVACLVQAHPDWTVDQMRSFLFASASDQVANGHPDPLFVRGYGIVNALGAHELDCPADFNRDGGVDGGDVEAFFIAWENADASADTNRDGGVDGADVEAFFIPWTAGGC